MPAPVKKADIEALLPYAEGEKQKAVLDAIISQGSQRKAAALLGIDTATMCDLVARIRAQASLKGVAPEHGWKHSVPDTHYVKGVSTFYNLETGEPVRQWVKADVDAQAREARYRAFLAGLKDEIPKARKAPKPTHRTAESLCNLFVLTDYHFGMKSWGEMTGDDYDLKIAEDLLVAWFEQAITQAPNAKQAVFGQLGDFLHWDSLDAVTPQSKHPLDADTRYQKIVRMAIRVLRRVTDMLLAKHEQVHVIMADANHDPAGSAWLREAFSVFYEHENRVTVDTSPDTYYCFEWGQTSLFFHHGHKRKPSNVSDVFAAKFRDVFGRTKHSYGHLGHLHHRHLIETNLMVVEQHRTLAAKDAYASSGGWMAGRDAAVITYSKEFGEVGRVTISPEMVS